MTLNRGLGDIHTSPNRISDDVCTSELVYPVGHAVHGVDRFATSSGPAMSEMLTLCFLIRIQITSSGPDIDRYGWHINHTLSGLLEIS